MDNRVFTVMNLHRVFNFRFLAAVLAGVGVLFQPTLEAAQKPQKISSTKKRTVTTSRIATRADLKNIKTQPSKTTISVVRLKKHEQDQIKNKPIRAGRPSFGQLAGLGTTTDFLGLESNAAFIVDLTTNEVLLDKNSTSVLPIASLTKLMTALVVSDEQLPLNEHITITEDDVDHLKGSGSRLAVGTVLTRFELLHLALMSSENRAAHALGRTYPGGTAKFVEVMNAKAKLIGMMDTKYVDPTGLSPSNQSSARDLSHLVAIANERPLIRELSTSTGYAFDTGEKTLQFRNSNQLVSNPAWDIGLQKTGYIAEAGRCLVMLSTVAGRQLVMVFLDSAGKLARVADAERVKKWVENLR
jgi:D-alanyl-D-alanine endopeptidase (penicillin-binding protein 7)